MERVIMLHASALLGWLLDKLTRLKRMRQLWGRLLFPRAKPQCLAAYQR
jgi:hypothetical protein